MKIRIPVLMALLLLFGFSAYQGLIWYLSKPAAPLVRGPVLSLDQGDIQAGFDPDTPDILQFNGLPYATPPIGDLRWRPPQAASGWQSVRDGRIFGPECLQVRSGSQAFIDELAKGFGLNVVIRHLARQVMKRQPPPVESEDCLYLNVRTSNLEGTSLQPVMVWLHGGSHASGAGSQDVYQANGLVRHDIVLVTINYRLGPFGYLAHPTLSTDDPRGVSGNYGLLDQIAALEWVRDNISEFGGDPDNVTLFGESAGAQSVTEIMASPSGDGLYHKAILQSGASTYNSNGLMTAIAGRMSMHEAGLAFLEGLSEAEASAAELRAIPAEALLARKEARPDLNGYLLPTVDGLVLPALIGQQIRERRLNTVPILAGYNSDEGTLFIDNIQRPTVLVPDFPESHAERLRTLETIYGPSDAATLISEYDLSDASKWQKGATDMLGDDLFGVHMRYLAKAIHASDHPVWTYFFTRKPPSPKQTIGAFHAAEIFFVFDSHTPLMPLQPEDRVLTEAMGKYWTNFARTGDPNGAGLPAWPAYTPDTDRWLELGHTIQPINKLRATRLDVLERALDERVAKAAFMITPGADPVGSGKGPAMTASLSETQ